MAEKSLMKGNEALAEAAIRAGCKCFFGYPITPQTEISAYLSKRMPKVGGVFLQAESEVAAINMVYGCAGSGIRCMTSSSSPGISLKTEGISYIAGSDLPCVIIDVQRGGPGLGGIQPSQADYWQITHALGHGDFHAIVFAPASVQEMVDTVTKAFDLADEYRMPAVILADGLLGQMMEPVEFKDTDATQIPEKPWATVGTQMKRKRNVINSLFIEPKDLEDLILERQKKYDEITKNEVRYEAVDTEDADIVLVAYGTTARIAKTAMAKAKAKGIKVGIIRPITLWPFPYEAFEKALNRKKDFLTVEMSMGQMVDDVKIAVNGRGNVHFYGRTGGVVPTPNEILAEIEKIAGGDR